ncbi:MAG: FAD binding domain-containing protein [Xenococcaceae cyanobacterium MO_188.B32]|nr:FAD binding domain-containing protein [Xenococcaceae cyanobacterium MO_188.B32]
MTDQIHFILNDRTVCTSQPTGVTVLDYLRLSEKLTGTKEGCKEGGCGACTVLLGELQGEKLVYKTFLSCLLPLGELSGKHLVTIEGLNREQLSPIQQALVDYGATQCGFCTPGIVMSLTGYLLASEKDIDRAEVKTALNNNLCRCTGYGAIKRAGSKLVQSLGNGEVHNLETWIDRGIVPEYFRYIPDRLQQLPQSILESENDKVSPKFVIAGGTDLYVQQGDILAESTVRLLNRSPQMKGISTDGDRLHIGALTTFAEFANHSAMIELIPYIQTYIQRIASHTIRQRATVGGNIITASPIGDISVMLLALNADLVLQAGDDIRNVPLREFFQGYKKTAKKSGEILTEIIIAIPPSATKFNSEKVSKRQYLDCAAVNSALSVAAPSANAIRCEGDTIREISISMGGVAPIPLFLKQTSNYLIGKRVNQEAIAGALPLLQGEISPIADIHGSASYKRLLARQLLIAHFTKLFPEFICLQDFYATN